MNNRDEICDENKYVYPRRLTMVQMGNNCMFCENPQGESYISMVELDDKMGYIYCKECKDADKGKQAIEIWNNILSYGKVHYLKGRDIKVKRSPRLGETEGVIESGWKLHNSVTSINNDFEPVVSCYNEALDLHKWCLIETIMELNPKNEVES